MKSLEDRFWEKVDKTPGHGPSGNCWVWIASLGTGGYGQFKWYDKLRGSHVCSWMIHFGETNGLCVLHKCDNKKCINPDHLFLGTIADNVKDMISKNRQAINYGEKCGNSKLTTSQVSEILFSDLSHAELSRKYGVSTTAIWQIKHRKRWQHLDVYENDIRINRRRKKEIREKKQRALPKWVCYFPAKGNRKERYGARRTVNKRTIWIGTYSNAEEAYNAAKNFDVSFYINDNSSK